MTKCVICGNPITTENASKEHIIPNAIGGILEDVTIYCKACNSALGYKRDRLFTDIFIPIVENLKIRKSRKTKGSSYKGIMYDSAGNCYHVVYKGGKVKEIKDSEGKIVVHKTNSDMLFGGLEFNLDNSNFKFGLAKIAFNYAVHCGIDAGIMNRLFDNEKKNLTDIPIVYPFIPMTPFDAIIEAQEPERLFHALRLFNINHILYVYIELFSTFQFYVVVSDIYNGGDINYRYCNYIEMNEKIDKELLYKMTPSNIKDADIIMTQYGIRKEDIIGIVKRNNNYNPTDKSSNWSLICKEIGKIAFNKYRTKSYEQDYGEVVTRTYNTAGFAEIVDDIISDNLESGDIDDVAEFISSFQFYTVYNDDYVNLDYYKRILPDGRGYPEAIYDMLMHSDSNASVYTKCKFKMLVGRFKH